MTLDQTTEARIKEQKESFDYYVKKLGYKTAKAIMFDETKLQEVIFYIEIGVAGVVISRVVKPGVPVKNGIYFLENSFPCHERLPHTEFLSGRAENHHCARDFRSCKPLFNCHGSHYIANP